VVVFKLLAHREVNLDGNVFDVFDVHPYEWFGVDDGEFINLKFSSMFF
jgi:hypothetical protein